MEIKELCQKHPEYNDRMYFKEIVAMTAVNLIDNICKMLDDGYVSNKNDGNSWILYWLGLTTKKPEDIFSLVTYKSARASIPDCDLDFEDDRREEMINYIINKYGDDRVAQVVTFNHMKARAAVRDVGRALGIPLYITDLIAKSIKNTPGKPINLHNSLDKESEYYSEDFAKYVKEDDCAKKIYKHAIELENKVRQGGIHAAAVLIGDIPLVERIPLMVVKNAKTKLVSQLDYPTAESIGMLKVDLLGLITLRIIRVALELINKRHNKQYDMYSIPYESKSSYKLLQSGNTIGVFQVENSGLTRYLVQMGPETFGQVADMISLYRPGPIGYIPTYISRLHGLESLEYKHPLLKEITQDTQAVLIYQEEINKVFMQLGGYHAGDADKLRKAISKKNVTEIEKNRKIFVSGCIKNNNIDESVADSIYNDINEFALYGFNKCISGKEIIKRDKNQYKKYTIAEMFSIKNSLKYAKSINAVNLHYKLKYNGYGMAFSMNENNRIVKNKIKDIRHVGVRDVYRVTLESGKTIDVTENHKFPTPNGIFRTDELHTGDKLYISGEHIKTQKKYNLYSEKQPVNSEKGKEGFQERINGNSRIYKDIIKNHQKNNNACEICGKNTNRYELHHINLDRTDNSPENLQWLCVSCHKKEHYKNGRTKRYENGLSVSVEQITSIEKVANEDVYDVEMFAPYHNFVLDNGIVTCNSHAASYARITLITAWLKANYPVEFITACLQCDGGDNSKRTKYIQDAVKNGIKVLPPQIGGSADFSINERGEIIFGCSFVDGIGDAIANKISNATIDTIFNIGLKKNQLEKLVQCGMFDVLGNRQELLYDIENIEKYAKHYYRWNKIGQKLMFYPSIKLSGNKKGVYDTAILEYEAIGAWLTYHPLQVVPQRNKDAVDRIGEIIERGNCIVVITSLEEMTTKKGQKMYKFIGVDEFGAREVILGAKLSKGLELKNGMIVHLSLTAEEDEQTCFCQSLQILNYGN